MLHLSLIVASIECPASTCGQGIRPKSVSHVDLVFIFIGPRIINHSSPKPGKTFRLSGLHPCLNSGLHLHLNFAARTCIEFAVRSKKVPAIELAWLRVNNSGYLDLLPHPVAPGRHRQSHEILGDSGKVGVPNTDNINKPIRSHGPVCLSSLHITSAGPCGQKQFQKINC